MSQTEIVDFQNVKFIRLSSQEKVCAQKCFERDYINSSNEIEINAALKHETILPLIGLSIPNQNRNDYSIITQFMPNDTLKTFIKRIGSIKLGNN